MTVAGNICFTGAVILTWATPYLQHRLGKKLKEQANKDGPRQLGQGDADTKALLKTGAVKLFVQSNVVGITTCTCMSTHRSGVCASCI